MRYVPMSELFILYKNEYLSRDYKEDETSGYLLYSIEFANDSISKPLEIRSVLPINIDKVCIDRFYYMQEYFENNSIKEPYGYFTVETYKKYTKKDNDLNEHISLKILNKETTSIFLGLFLKAYEILEEHKYSINWNKICITGDIYFENGNIKPNKAEHIEEKYKAFIKQTTNYKAGNLLFIYIYDGDDMTEDKLKKICPKPDNVTIKQFNSEEEIKNVLCFISNDFGKHFIDKKYMLHERDGNGNELLIIPDPDKPLYYNKYIVIKNNDNTPERILFWYKTGKSKKKEIYTEYKTWAEYYVEFKDWSDITTVEQVIDEIDRQWKY